FPTAPSTSMPTSRISAMTAGTFAAACCAKQAWQPCRDSISIHSAVMAHCASLLPVRHRTWKRPCAGCGPGRNEGVLLRVTLARLVVLVALAGALPAAAQTRKPDLDSESPIQTRALRFA